MTTYRPENREAYTRGNAAKSTPPAKYQPYFVTVPYRADTVKDGTPLNVALGDEWVKDAASQIKAVENEVAGNDEAKEYKPDDV